MRGPLKATVLLAVMVLASFSVVSAQYYEPAVFVNVAEVQGLTAEGLIPEGGGNLVIPVRFKNVDVKRTAISNGYLFSKGTATFENIGGAWNPAYPWDWIHAYPAGCFPPVCYPYFDQVLMINYFTKTLAQTAVTADAAGIGFAGLTGGVGTGLPATFNDIAYRITLTGVAGGGSDSLVMDSSFWMPANYWVWTGVGENVYWGGPYVFKFEGGGGEAPVITSTAITTGQVSVPYTYDVNATGDPVPTYLLSVFPDGMTINTTTGVINWTPTVAGPANVTVVATNSEGTATQSFTIEVIPAYTLPVFTSTPVTTGQVGVAYTYDANATGYPTPTYSLFVSQAGMTINTTTGVITWTPTAAGTFPVTVRANNLAGDTDQPYSITVVPAPTAPVIVAIDDKTASTGATFTYDVDVQAGCYPAPTFSLVTKPASMTIDPVSGMISWVVNETGVIPVTVRATNTAGSDTEDFTITVSACSPYTTFLWDDAMIFLKNLPEGRTMQFGIWCDNFDDIVWASIRVFNIPPYTTVRIENIDGENVLVTDAFVMRFLGAGGFRPIPSTGYTNSAYPLSYTYKDGTDITLSGIFSLDAGVGDVTFDGVANIDDIVFLTDFFFNGGPTATLWDEKMDEFMDVDQSGRIDLLDAEALMNVIGF